MQWEKAVQFATFQSLTLSQRRELWVYVCVEELSSSSTLEEGEGEEGEQVAYLALDCRDQHCQQIQILAKKKNEASISFDMLDGSKISATANVWSIYRCFIAMYGWRYAHKKE